MTGRGPGTPGRDPRGAFIVRVATRAAIRATRALVATPAATPDSAWSGQRSRTRRAAAEDKRDRVPQLRFRAKPQRGTFVYCDSSLPERFQQPCEPVRHRRTPRHGEEPRPSRPGAPHLGRRGRECSHNDSNPSRSAPPAPLIPAPSEIPASDEMTQGRRRVSDRFSARKARSFQRRPISSFKCCASPDSP